MSDSNNYPTVTILISLSFLLPFSQIIIILSLLFQSPFRKPLLLKLDRFKTHLSLTCLTSTLFLLFIYNLYSVFQIRRRFVVNSHDHFILVYHMIEAYILGFTLFLLVVINRVHEYIKEFVMVTETIQAANKQNRGYKDCMKKTANEAEIIRKDISRLKTEISNLESECSIKEQVLQLEKADSSILKSTLEGLLGQYDLLLADNKDLKDQLQHVNERLSRSDGRKSVFFSWDRWGL